ASNDAAMERLLVDAQALAYRFSLLVCGHTEDAEDAMQDALLQTYKNARRIRQPKGFRTWLYRTVKNACLMSRRTRVDEPRRMTSIDDDAALEVAADAPDPEALTAAAAERRRFQAAFRQLPRPYRLVAFLRDVEGLSTREVADIAGISEANVKKRLQRARLMLKQALCRSAARSGVPREIRTRARRHARALLDECRDSSA
ncbi:MAG: sigma-70 family RNA polymerase sigma factor, partial [Acidobacteria bacterium]|nr:sigma-70 family RNA polymerase sigma factor [Acidobacteriota bacterium]